MIKGMKTLVLIAILVISLSFVYADCIPNEKLAGSQTINDVKFKTITTNLNQTTSEYIQTIQVLNTAKSVKNISYTKYSCRCQKTIGNGNNKICIAYWPDDLFNCHGIEESLSLAPGETEIIEISVSQYQNKVCGTFQTDLWINSINGKNFNKLSVWALAHLCEDCSIERCEEEKSCLTPDDYGITSSVKIKPSGERTLQKYLDDAGVKVNVSQQDNIQTWDFKNPGNVTLEITYIGGHTNHQDIFGYKVDSGNFTTIGDLKTIGSQIITLSGDNSITFGIKDVNLNKIRYTEKSLNENTENYTVTYSLCDNTYAIGFEDYADFDYQDLIVLVKVLGCEQKCISTEEVCEGLDNNCNGEIDEGYVETETSCGVGECARTGLLQCISGEEVDSCVEGDSETEVCDGLDNNCNGVIDENPNSLCDNGLFCDGQETCSNGGCIPGQLIDCTNSSILIDNCTNNPDSNQFTFDFYEFPSSCDEELQGCIQKPINWLDLITHECSKENCGAECDAQNSCSDKEGNKTFYDTCDEKMLVDYNNNNNLDNETISASCSRDCNLNSCGCGDCDLTFEDLIPETKCVLGVCGATCENNEDCEETVCTSGCVGNDWYEYSDVSNSCNSCGCGQNECGEPTVIPNDKRCVQCTDNSQCANLTKESCSGEAHVIKEGVCVDYKCQLAHPSVIEDCSLKDGIVGCGELQWGCTEEINRIHCTITDITPNDALCLDDSGCNGLETCNPVTYICEQGQAVDCSVFNISRIDSCDNNPDNNPFTIDLRTAFTSQCVDLEQGQFECTTGNEEITHDCSLGCGAECDAQNLCSNKEGNKTFYDDCNEKMLVDYNDNSKLDNTTVTASCSRDCDLDSCGCGDCDLIFEDLIPETKCVLGVCGATCENNEDCEETVCTSGCVGNDWYEYSNVSNSCNSCACEQNQCGAPVITENDPICGECVNGDEESRNCGSSDIGVCEFGNQTRTCEDGEWQQWGECTGEVLPGTETCNNLDDDCDILIDEGFNKGGACSAGIGVCMNNGTLVCSQDGLGTECSAQPLPPQEQTETSCSDHQDNDCDGLIDCQDSDCQEQPGCHIECFDDSWCEPWPLACHGNFCFDSDTIYQNITRGKCEMPGTTLSRCVVEWSVINWQECYPGICQGEWPNAQCVDNFCENDSECGTSLLLNNYCVGNDLYSNYTRHYCDGVCKLDFEQMLNETNSSICFEECSVNEDCPAGSSETFCINQSLINSTRVPYCEANRCGFNEINNTIGSCNNETNNETNPPVNNNPVVNLVSPVNDYVTSSNSIGFEYNVSDDGNISNCNLKINGNITNTVTDVPRNANEMFIKSLAIGTYTWQVSCFDGINYGNSEIRNLRIIEESNNDDNHNSCVSGCGGGSTSLISGVSGCGNGICETGENYNNCQLDCLKSSSSISGLGYQNYSVIELSTVKKKTSSGWWWVWLLILLILLLLLLLLLLLTRKSDN